MRKGNLLLKGNGKSMVVPMYLGGRVSAQTLPFNDAKDWMQLADHQL